MNKKSILTVFLFGTVASTTYPIHPSLLAYANALGGYAKSIAQFGSGVALWALPIKWGVKDELSDGNENRHFSSQIKQRAQLPNKPVKLFIEQSLNSGGLQDVSKITIQMDPSVRDYCISDKGDLTIPYDNSTFQKNIDENNEDELANASAAIAHEISHYIHKDNFIKEIFVNPGTMLGVSTGALILQKLLWPAPISPSIIFTIGRTCTTVPVYLLAKRLKALYSQRCEWRADENIPQERLLLESQTKYYNKKQKEDQEIFEHNKKVAIKKLLSKQCISGLGELGNAYTTIKYDWFSSHPHPAKRLARFKERLAALDKSE